MDLRDVRKEEWLSLLDTVAEKCIYEAVILDLGDSIDGLYDILERCGRVYTPYISDRYLLLSSSSTRTICGRQAMKIYSAIP